MNNTTTFYFVRHGAVDNPNNIYYGRLPGFHLDKSKYPEVEEAARILSKFHIAAIFSSPLERAFETAEIIAKQLNKNIRDSKDLSEVYSPYDGQPMSLLKNRDFDVYTGSPPEHEQPSDILKRVKDFLTTVRESHSGKQIVVVTHGDVIAFTILWANGLPIIPQQKVELYKSFLTYASISSFTFETNSEDEIPKFELLFPSIG